MSAGFSPIAIVGRACVLPGALSPEQLWQALADGRDLLSSAPAGRWNMPHGAALCSAEDSRPDCAWSDRGGYVSGFESVWNPQGFAVPAEQLDGLDPLMHWTLHCGREALRQARAVNPARSGAIFGNLGFPSAAMAAFAQSVWTGEGEVDARNRFMSSGSAELLRRALQLGAGSFCLDAACASSLYAIKLACDRLHDGAADLMLAGAVQRADDLFLHVGFSALNALSRSGQSRPFHAQADGLVPAEGAAFLALKRLEDARRDGDRIHGVIRGIGLSNDGRGKGLLVPAEEGQRRAIRAAFDGSGLSPKQISLLECHATGTPVGDATEVRSSAAEFAECEALPIGSLKSNLGHLITTAGAAAIIKVLEAMRHAQRPPTLHVEAPNPALQNTPFRLLTELEAWPSQGPRCAAVSAFGFGGNNAHVLLSEDSDEIAIPASAPEAASIAVVALGGRVGRHADRVEFTRDLFSAAAGNGDTRAETIEVDLQGLRVPPNDLAQALPQQLAILQASREALDEVAVLPSARCAAYIGMEPDPEVARYGLRWRLAARISDPVELARQRDAVIPALQSAAVLGTMPNIPANRLSSQFDLHGPAFTVQAGADSGLVALQLAARALRQGEIDAALVGAVDFSCEPVHQTALPGPAGDAALVWVLKRQADAVRDGDQIYALLDRSGLCSAEISTLRMGDAENRGRADGEQAGAADPLLHRYGRAFAAHRMLQLSAAALALHHRRHLDGRPWLSADPRRASISGASERSVSLIEAGAWVAASAPCAIRLHCYSGADRGEVIAALQAGREGLDGPTRLVLLSDGQQLAAQRSRALAHLQSGAPAGSTIFFCERPIIGGLGFVFAGAGAAYAGMGRELLLQLPQLQDRLALRSRRLALGLDWALAGAGHVPTALQQLQGASALCQLHADFSRHVLGLRAEAWLGYSSGETNALFAAGVWNDPDALLQEMEQSGLMSRELGGEFSAIARAWGGPAHWANWSVLAPLDEVRARLEAEPKVHLAIINSDKECMISGEAEACARVIDQLGRSRCLPVDYALAAHVPELAQVETEWLRLHRRACRAPRSGRVYSNAWGRSYTPDSEQCAQAILQQANRSLDLRPAILQAWADGIRIFVEHGPGSTYSRAIRSVLGEREALVLSLDRRGQGIEGLLACAAALLAAGVAIDLDRLHATLGGRQASPISSRRLRVPAHAADIVLAPTSLATAGRNEPEHAGSPLVSKPQRMPSAPALPSVLAVASQGAAANAERWRAELQTAASPRSLETLSATTAAANSSTAIAASLAATPASSRQTAALSAHLTQIAQLQQNFLREQAAAQQRFLGLRAAALQTLLQAACAPGAGMLPTSPRVTATSAGQSAAVTASVSASEAPACRQHRQRSATTQRRSV